jgi:hypothetical protein
MIPREILKKIRQIEIRTNRSGLVWVAQATGLCRPATRRTEWRRMPKTIRPLNFFESFLTSVRRVAEQNGRVARSTRNFPSFCSARP